MTETTIRNAAFLNRFQSVYSRKRRTQLGQVAVSTVLLALVGLGSIAVADYVWELDRSARAMMLSAAVVGVLAFAVNSLWRTSRSWGRPKTAAEIELAFPELGQSVRTTVQFGAMQVEQCQSEGVATTLVAALAQQTHQRALPLTIEDVIPSKRLWLLAAGVAVGALLLAGASSVDWEWQNATQRAVLAETPYRSLEVMPGNQLVDEGAGTQIDVALIGRTNREVVLWTRAAEQADAEWTERTLEAREGETLAEPRTVEHSSADVGASEPNGSAGASPSRTSFRPRAAFVAKFDRLMKGVEYRVTAGELSSPVYRIDIRRPLRMDEIKIELTPPSYTGQPMSVSLDPNLSVLQGTVAKFDITFDKPVKSAAIVLAPRKKPRDDDDKNEPEVVPLRSHHAPRDEPNGETAHIPTSDQKSSESSDVRLVTRSVTTTLTASLTLNEDRNYSIIADAEDGTKLPENKYRIRVREDQPPQVTIEEPTDAVEVHSLAELPMRIRVRDDYGLSRAGIIFQINNEQQIPLIAQDFETVVAAAKEVAESGKVSTTTQAALAKVLPLEVFELTQKDSLMYFAFAEDNRPENPQRTETDMRFIDIRPFKRTFQVLDPDPGNGMGMRPGFKALEELIQKQRFGLNRTMQIEKRAAAGRKPDAVTLDQLMQFETELAKNVRETAEGLVARGVDDVELFYQAETAMLAAVDSLSVAKWENATLQMKDALKMLIEARDTIRRAIFKNPDAVRLAALRQFDRVQAQKIRRPKTDKEEARELIRRLEQLIAEENGVVEALEDDGEKSEPQKAEQQ